MIASGSPERAKRPKRCSPRNVKSPQQLVSDSPPADQSARKPRVLGISPAAPNRLTEGKHRSPEPQTTREVPRSQFPRIRSWVKYGMTVAQVAEVYGVAVDDIERILRKA